MNKGKRMVDNQTPEAVETVSEKVTDFGSIRQGTFSISIKGEKDSDGKEKMLYENKEEPFEYDVVNSLVNVLRHAGAKLEDAAIDSFGKALKSADAEADKTITDALQAIVRIYNNKLKADAKNSAYQTLVNKHKPLEGEKKESAQSRMVANFVKLAGVSLETAIAQLKLAKALPEDFTAADIVPLRKSKGDDGDE